MDIQELIGKVSGKKQEEKGAAPTKELIKFKEGILDKYPSVELKLTVYTSSFGIHIVTSSKEKKDKEAIMEGALTIYSDEENLLCLLSQLEAAEKQTELDKYKRIHNQSKLIAFYRTKKMDDEFIKNMIASMPVEYEFQIVFTPKQCKKIETKTIKIYIDNTEDVNIIEKNLELFRENAMSQLLEETIASFSSDAKKSEVSC